MIKHFNTYDIYRQNNYNIYPEKQMLAIDRLNSLCRYHALEYLIDCTILKHRKKSNGGCIFMFHLKFHDLWSDSCADIVKQLIELTNSQLFNNSKVLRDYIWFLKQKNCEKNINATIIFFGNGETFARLDMIVKALQELLIMQKHLTGFKIDIPTLIPELRKPLIMRHADTSDGSLLLDIGFASDFNFPEDTNK